MEVRSSCLILLSFEKERSALQFVTIIDEYIRNAVSNLRRKLIEKKHPKDFLKAINNAAIQLEHQC